MPDAPTIDITNRVKRAVWFTKVEPFTATAAVPPLVSFHKAGPEISDPTAPFTGGGFTPVGKPAEDMSAEVYITKPLVPCVVMKTETSSNWMGNDDDGWMAGFTPVAGATVEADQIYTAGMRPGPGETKWYMGASNMLPSVYVSTDKFFCLKGPTHWRNFKLRGIFKVAPIPENFGHFHQESLMSVSGTNWTVPVMASSNPAQSGNPYANFVSICMGDWGSSAQRAPRYCLLFRLPSWEPILYVSRSATTAPDVGEMTHPSKNPQLNEWQEVPRSNDPREGFQFDTGEAQEINFTAYIEGGCFYVAMQPWGTGQKTARFSWKLDAAEGRKDESWSEGAADGEYKSDLELQGKTDNDKLNTQLTEGRILVMGNGAPVHFCLGTEFEPYDGGGDTRELVAHYVTSWSSLKQMAADNNAGGTVEESDIKDMLKSGTVVVSHHPIHDSSLTNYVNPTIDSVTVDTDHATAAADGSTNSDDCIVKVTIKAKAGYAQAPNGGPKTKVFPKIRYVRFIAEPYTNLGDGMLPETGSFYLQNGLDFSLEAGAEGEVSGSTRFDIGESGGYFPGVTDDPRTGSWQDTDEYMSAEGLRGFPSKTVCGYAFIDDSGNEVYKMWPVAKKYTDKATFQMSAGGEVGSASIIGRMNEVGRHALLQKAKGFSLPAMDGYSHFYAIKLLANYAGIADTEMAPWTVGVSGPKASSGQYQKTDSKPSLALVDKQFAPQTDAVLASWDAPCPGQVENVGGENGNWRFLLSPGGSVYDLMQQIARTFGFRLYFDNLGLLHYEPDLFPLMAGGIIAKANAAPILQHLAKGEFITEDHFSYENSIITMESTNVMLGRHDGVMVMGEALYPTCVCGRANCRLVGQTVNNVYHYVRWGGSLPWNSTRKIPAFRYVYANTPQQARNPMLRKTWLYISSPHLTTPAMVNSYAAYLQNWCSQWWVGDLYNITMIGQPHLWPGDFISIAFPNGTDVHGYPRYRYFYIRTVHHGCSNGRFDTTVTGMLLPTQESESARKSFSSTYTSSSAILPTPPASASSLEWGGRKPTLTTYGGEMEDWF